MSIKHKWNDVMKNVEIYEKQGMRYGQSLFNAVYDIDPIVANKLRGSDKDCFHNDKKVVAFVSEVLSYWYENK